MATAVFSSFSFFSNTFRNWIQNNQWMMWTSLVGSFVFLFLTMWKSKSYPANLLFLSGFTLLEAYTVALVVSFYEARIVIQALLLTLGIFFALTLFACQTKYDFTGLGPYLFGFLSGVIVFGFISMFFPFNSTMELVYSGGVAILFSFYILYDTQNIMKNYHADEEVAAAMALYLDVLNLFLSILRILNSMQRDD
jgi:protein lifeguard